MRRLLTIKNIVSIQSFYIQEFLPLQLQNMKSNQTSCHSELSRKKVWNLKISKKATALKITKTLLLESLYNSRNDSKIHFDKTKFFKYYLRNVVSSSYRSSSLSAELLWKLNKHVAIFDDWKSSTFCEIRAQCNWVRDCLTANKSTKSIED